MSKPSVVTVGIITLSILAISALLVVYFPIRESGAKLQSPKVPKKVIHNAEQSPKDEIKSTDSDDYLLPVDSLGYEDINPKLVTEKWEQITNLENRLADLKVRETSLESRIKEVKLAHSGQIQYLNPAKKLEQELFQLRDESKDINFNLGREKSELGEIAVKIGGEAGVMFSESASPSSETEKELVEISSELKSNMCYAAKPAGYLTQKVFFATDRKSVKTNGKIEGFSDDRNTKGLTYGLVSVTIPKIHKFGHIEQPDRFDVLLRHVGREFQMTLAAIQEYTINDFISAAAAKSSGKDGSHALIFIHGFNNSFSEASLRAGQMAYDLGFTGPTILYSWASNGVYNSDIERSQYTIPQLTNFLTALLDCNKFKEVSIIAHSMGNRALGGALTEIARSRPKTKFNQIILAAPDIDALTFEVIIAPKIQPFAKRYTIYSSRKDLALWASKKVNINARLGIAALPVVGFQFVDISPVDCVDMFAHSCYAEAYPVLADINAFLTHNSEPAQRLLAAKDGHWIIKSAK